MLSLQVNGESKVNSRKVGGIGDRGGFTYKRTRRGNAEIDRVFEYFLGKCGDSRIIDFSPMVMTNGNSARLVSIFP